jgi:hypothetical protein
MDNFSITLQAAPKLVLDPDPHLKWNKIYIRNEPSLPTTERQTMIILDQAPPLPPLSPTADIPFSVFWNSSQATLPYNKPLPKTLLGPEKWSSSLEVKSYDNLFPPPLCIRKDSSSSYRRQCYLKPKMQFKDAKKPLFPLLNEPLFISRGPNTMILTRPPPQPDQGLASVKFYSDSRSLGKDNRPTGKCSVEQQILDHVSNLQTLFSLTIVNKAFFKAFQPRALSFIRQTIAQMSPALSELREMIIPWSRKPRCDEHFKCLTKTDGFQPEYNVQSYLVHYSSKVWVLVKLKARILQEIRYPQDG